MRWQILSRTPIKKRPPVFQIEVPYGRMLGFGCVKSGERFGDPDCLVETKAFAYLRVSGRGRVDGDGFTRQLTAIKKYAAANKIKIVRVFREEGVSGTWEDRPAFSEMGVLHQQRRAHRASRAP